MRRSRDVLHQGIYLSHKNVNRMKVCKNIRACFHSLSLLTFYRMKTILSAVLCAIKM